MTFEEILRDVKQKKFVPLYFLHGEEPYFIDRLDAAIEQNALSEAERSFNQTILYGKETDALTLLDTLRRYPMMSERQVVILREAQEMKSLADLAAYIDHPMPTTLFVICYKHKKYDMNTKFGKALKAKSLVFESKKLYDNQAPEWISAYCKSRNLGIEFEAAQLLADYLGTDLAKISNEIDKLALNLPSGATVNAKHVQDYVGISKDYNVYELQKAFATRDLAKIARIEQYFIANIRKNPIIVTISSLFAFFSKVYMLHFIKNSSDAEAVKILELRSEWFLKDYKAGLNNYRLAQLTNILHLLKQYDLRAKGVDNDTTHNGDDALMQELFFQIIHA